jgi:hypothetical protein
MMQNTLRNLKLRYSRKDFISSNASKLIPRWVQLMACRNHMTSLLSEVSGCRKYVPECKAEKGRNKVAQPETWLQAG